METRLLTNKESEEAGFAVGTLLTLFDRIITGEFDFSLEQYEQIGKASEILSKYDEEELLELINLGIYWSVN
jgi:hypothetical protein